MNFFAHTCIAASTSEHPGFLLGAMLPDLASMMAVRIAQVFDAEVRAGVEHHHATDAAFHATPVFTELCAEGLQVLAAQGVERGTARAVAHVGIELLLDGVLCHDRPACSRYRGALSHAQATPLDTMLALRQPEALPQLRDGIARLITAPLPEGYRDPEFVAARLHYILARRPRLAMREGDIPDVLAWLRQTRAKVVSQHELLLSQVAVALAANPGATAK